MAKKKRVFYEHEHHRGEVRHCSVAALATSVLFRAKVEKPKTGKGSFRRHDKHKGRGGDYFSAPSLMVWISMSKALYI